MGRWTYLINQQSSKMNLIKNLGKEHSEWEEMCLGRHVDLVNMRWVC